VKWVRQLQRRLGSSITESSSCWHKRGDARDIDDTRGVTNSRRNEVRSSLATLHLPKVRGKRDDFSARITYDVVFEKLSRPFVRRGLTVLLWTQHNTSGTNTTQYVGQIDADAIAGLEQLVTLDTLVVNGCQFTDNGWAEVPNESQAPFIVH
jgi:hypothetical protein